MFSSSNQNLFLKKGQSILSEENFWAVLWQNGGRQGEIN